MGNQLFKNGYALLIGIGSPDLPSTERDARAIAELLRDRQLAAYPEDQVEVLTRKDAKLASIRSAFDRLTAKANADPAATVIIFFSGHGGRYASDREQNYYLQPYDGDPARVAETMLSGEEFTHHINRLTSRKLIVILDCCYAGGQYRTKDTGRGPEHIPSHQTLVDKLNSGAGRVILASCLDQEVSYAGDPYSIFTSCLLEALKGANSRNKDRYVHILDLLHYVFATVPERTSHQHTVQHPFVNRIDNLNTEFFICRYDPKEASGIKADWTDVIQQKLAEDFHKFADNYIKITTAHQVDISSAAEVKVTDSNVTINQTIIQKDHQHFHEKLLQELGILPYLVNREEQDLALFPQFRAVGQHRRHLVGVLHGAFDQYPQRYVDRLLYYLGKWIEKDDPDPSLAGPKEIPMVWPERHRDQADLRRQVFNNFVSKGLVSLQTTDPIEKFYRENSNRHLLFYTTLTVDPSRGPNYYQEVIRGFFEFWATTPPRESPLKTLAMLILIYPAMSPTGLRRLLRLGGGLFGKRSGVDGLRKVLQEFYEMTTDPETGRERLLQQLAVEAGETSQSFVFPEVGSINIDHIIQWLQMEECRQLLGNLNLGFRYQELFYGENIQALTMHEFETYLTAFIKDT